MAIFKWKDILKDKKYNNILDWNEADKKGEFAIHVAVDNGYTKALDF